MKRVHGHFVEYRFCKHIILPNNYNYLPYGKYTYIPTSCGCTNTSYLPYGKCTHAYPLRVVAPNEDTLLHKC